MPDTGGKTLERTQGRDRRVLLREDPVRGAEDLEGALREPPFVREAEADEPQLAHPVALRSVA